MWARSGQSLTMKDLNWERLQQRTVGTEAESMTYRDSDVVDAVMAAQVPFRNEGFIPLLLGVCQQTALSCQLLLGMSLLKSPFSPYPRSFTFPRKAHIQWLVDTKAGPTSWENFEMRWQLQRDLCSWPRPLSIIGHQPSWFAWNRVRSRAKTWKSQEN